MSNNIKETIENIRNKNLVSVKELIEAELSKKAAEKLEEKKVDIASTYFGRK